MGGWLVLGRLLVRQVELTWRLQSLGIRRLLIRATALTAWTKLTMTILKWAVSFLNEGVAVVFRNVSQCVGRRPACRPSSVCPLAVAGNPPTQHSTDPMHRAIVLAPVVFLTLLRRSLVCVCTCVWCMQAWMRLVAMADKPSSTFSVADVVRSNVDIVRRAPLTFAFVCASTLLEAPPERVPLKLCPKVLPSLTQLVSWRSYRGRENLRFLAIRRGRSLEYIPIADVRVLGRVRSYSMLGQKRLPSSY